MFDSVPETVRYFGILGFPGKFQGRSPSRVSGGRSEGRALKCRGRPGETQSPIVHASCVHLVKSDHTGLSGVDAPPVGSSNGKLLPEFRRWKS